MHRQALSEASAGALRFQHPPPPLPCSSLLSVADGRVIGGREMKTPQQELGDDVGVEKRPASDLSQSVPFEPLVVGGCRVGRRPPQKPRRL